MTTRPPTGSHRGRCRGRARFTDDEREAQGPVCRVPQHQPRGGTPESPPLGECPSGSQAPLPAEAVWAPAPKEGPVPKAQSPTDGCPGWALPSEVATCAQPRAVQAGLADLEGPLAAQPGNGHRARGPAGHSPPGHCPALPRLATHSWGCKTKSSGGGGGGPHPLPDVKWRHGALHAPLNLGSQKVRDTQCVRSHQHRARQTARAHDCFRKCHPYYPHDNPEGTEAPREEVTSP